MPGYARPTTTALSTEVVVTPSGNISSTNLQGALVELDTEKPQVTTANLNSSLDAKAALASPTFTGTVVLPPTTSIGNVSNTELGYLDGLTEPLTTSLANKTAYGLFAKADPFSVAFTKTSPGTAHVKAGTSVVIGTTLVTFANDTSITMPTLTAGTDYFVYAKTDGTAQAVAATGTWPTAVASPPANSRLIGGFHYAPGGNATGTSGGNTTPQINEYSFWDLRWEPTCLDPRGMTLVANKFWSDIYLLNRSPDTNGTSKYNVQIADGETGGTTTAIIPAAFGGNGSNRYAIQDWWNTSECLGAYGKRCPSYAEYAQLAYGVTENSSVGTDQVSTVLNAAYTSKWGVIQASGVMWVWGDEFGGPSAAASWANTNGGRGQVYQQSNAVFLGGGWTDGANSGSRTSAWVLAPSNSANNTGGRGVCDHLRLV